MVENNEKKLENSQNSVQDSHQDTGFIQLNLTFLLHAYAQPPGKLSMRLLESRND